MKSRSRRLSSDVKFDEETKSPFRYEDVKGQLDELPIVAGLGDVLPLAPCLMRLRLGDHVHICEQKFRWR